MKTILLLFLCSVCSADYQNFLGNSGVINPFILNNTIRDLHRNKLDIISASDTYLSKSSATSAYVDKTSIQTQVIRSSIVVSGIEVASGTISSPNVMDFYTAGSKALSIDANGFNTKPLQPHMRAFRSTQQANLTAGTYNLINFDGETTDIGNDYDKTTTFLYTTPVTGTYLINTTVCLQNIIANTTATNYYIGIFVDNVNVSTKLYNFPAAYSVCNLSIIDTLIVANAKTIGIKIYPEIVGDTVDVYGDVNGLYTYFSVTLLQ